MTSRDVIRAAIADHEDPWTVVPQPDALAERIDRALFGAEKSEAQASAAGALVGLQAEVRRLLVLGKYAGRPAVRMRVAVVDPSDAPLIAALLREEAARV